MISIRVRGLDATQKVLLATPDRARTRLIKTGLRRAAAPVRESAKNLAPIHREPYRTKRGYLRMRKKYPAHRTRLTPKQIENRLKRIERFEQEQMKKLGNQREIAIFSKRMARKKRGVAKYYQLRKAGTLRRSIVVGDIGRSEKSAMKNIDTNVVSVGVGLRRQAFYGRFIELGWRHKTTPRGKPGKVTLIPPVRFLQRALMMHKDQIFSVFRDEIIKSINEARK